MTIAIFKNDRGYWDARVHLPAIESGAVPKALWHEVQSLVYRFNSLQTPVWACAFCSSMSFRVVAGAAVCQDCER